MCNSASVRAAVFSESSAEFASHVGRGPGVRAHGESRYWVHQVSITGNMPQTHEKQSWSSYRPRFRDVATRLRLEIYSVPVTRNQYDSFCLAGSRTDRLDGHTCQPVSCAVRSIGHELCR